MPVTTTISEPIDILKAHNLWGKIYEKCGRDTAYLAEIENLCKYALGRADMIVETFPLYTKHDHTHIVNVMTKMGELLGDYIEQIHADELAMLILAACFHDIGMSYSTEERAEYEDRNNNKHRDYKCYLQKQPIKYLDAYEASEPSEEQNLLNKESFQDFLRSIHHERVFALISVLAWPRELNGRVRKEDLISICKSHGQDISVLNDMTSFRNVDLRKCAILLRLADILDFDDSRAPQAIYEYHCFEKRTRPAEKYSAGEWEKHLSSTGFDFTVIEKDGLYFELPYYATCYNINTEMDIRAYLNWVDKELLGCREILVKYHTELSLPSKVERHIDSEGYVSGNYRLTMDQDKVLELLAGENLYDDPGVFVRELLQNAIDAVRTRRVIDQNLPCDWEPRIQISSWMEDDGHVWFRIEDNGIGMTRDIIEKHLLKVGNSYYTSEDFIKTKRRHGAEDFTPISRFGIGLLSCFMGDGKNNRVEISTKHYESNSPALRMRMDGLNGYYYLASSNQHYEFNVEKMPTELSGHPAENPYRDEPGTVIAVRTNMLASGKYSNFREVVDKYVCCPRVKVTYQGDGGNYDYPLEEEFMTTIRESPLPQNDVFDFFLTDKQMTEIRRIFPNQPVPNKIGVRIKLVCLDQYSTSKCMSGFILFTNIICVDKNHSPMQYVPKNISGPFFHASFENGLLGIRISSVDFPLIGQTPLPLSSDYLPWFKTHLTPLFERFHKSSRITAYNGVVCGNTQILESSLKGVDVAFLLLYDRFQPEPHLSRNAVRNLPLESLCEIDYLRYNLCDDGFLDRMSNVGQRLPSLFLKHEFASILQNRSDFLAKCEQDFKCEFSQLSASPNGACVHHRCLPLAHLYFAAFWDSLYLTYLQANYVVKYDFNHPTNSCCLSSATAAGQTDALDFFPPFMFLAPLQEKPDVLTHVNPSKRITCNVCHPLSQFIINHRESLEKHTCGLYQGMLRSLIHDSADTAISKINNYLDRLHTLPAFSSYKFPPPLTEDDFTSAWFDN